jgi:hypothetical protein
MTKREEIIAVLATRQGITVNEIAPLVGLVRCRAHGEVWRLVRIGAVVTLPAKPCLRIFSSQAELEAMRAQVNAETAAYLARRAEEKKALRRVKERKRQARAPRPPRKTRDKRAQAFKSLEVINPNGVSIQRITTPLPRFHVPDTFVGMFGRVGVGRDLLTGKAWEAT